MSLDLILQFSTFSLTVDPLYNILATRIDVRWCCSEAIPGIHTKHPTHSHWHHRHHLILSCSFRVLHCLSPRISTSQPRVYTFINVASKRPWVCVLPIIFPHVSRMASCIVATAYLLRQDTSAQVQVSNRKNRAIKHHLRLRGDVMDPYLRGRIGPGRLRMPGEFVVT
jgi:hypothetical protein